jgi:hypothetical protein
MTRPGFIEVHFRFDGVKYPFRRARAAFPVFDSLNRDAGRQLVKTQSSAL